MTDPRNPFNYPLNPEFGQGIYRRRLRLQKTAYAIQGDLEDCNHGFSVRIEHNGDVVTSVTGEHHRIPFTTCGGAINPLQQLTGISIHLDAQALAASVPARANCTHWLDLALMAIQHAKRDEDVRDYLIEVPDEAEAATLANIFCNGKLIHAWLLRDWIIEQPAAIAGNTIFKGFSAWANIAFTDPDVREAAFMLQKGYFVSRARRFDIHQLSGRSAMGESFMQGACYSYSSPQIENAVRTDGTLRDFTHTPEALLLFK